MQVNYDFTTADLADLMRHSVRRHAVFQRWRIFRSAIMAFLLTTAFYTLTSGPQPERIVGSLASAISVFLLLSRFWLLPTQRQYEAYVRTRLDSTGPFPFEVEITEAFLRTSWHLGAAVGGIRMKQLLLTSFILGCSSVALAVGADAEAPVSEAPKGHLDDLAALVRQVGAKAHKHFFIDPRLPQSVDLQGLDSREITYPQLLTILDVYGFVVFEENGLALVVPNTNARQQPMRVTAPADLPTADAELVTTILPVKNLNAAQLVPVLRPLMPQWAQLSVAMGTNALIICDRTANVKRIMQVIHILEAQPKTTVDAIPRTDQPLCTDEERRAGQCH